MAQTQVIQIENITVNSLLNAVEQLLDKRLSNISQPQAAPETELITRQQIADMFGVSLPTVHAWTNCGILTAYKIANKTRYKKSEVLAACKPINTKIGGRNAA